MKTVKILSMVLILLSLSITGVSALSTPVATTVAVELSSDQTIHNAATILKQNARVHIVKYGTLEYALLIHRTVNPVIWISHGNDKGFEVQHHLTQWAFAKGLIQHTIGKDIFLACHSRDLLNYGVNPSEVITFPGEIDSALGALLIAYALSRNAAIISTIVQRVNYLLEKPTSFSPLGLLGLSDIELSYWIIMAIITFFLIVLDWSMDPNWSIVQTTAIKLITFGKIGIMTTLIWLSQGWISLASAFSSIVGFIVDAAGYLIDAFNAASWWEKLIYGLSFAVALACLVTEISATAGQSIWWKVAATLTAIMALGAGVASDAFDNNDYVG